MKIGLLGVLGLLFLAFKLSGIITWPWILVLSPFILMFAIFLIILSIFAYVFIKEMKYQNEINKRRGL